MEEIASERTFDFERNRELSHESTKKVLAQGIWLKNAWTKARNDFLIYGRVFQNLR
ncbi:hypothetical protein SAMN04488104_10337 [Algoriphagus faecimaris]|uniref:Uncharacterized protein n=1 Tax=Algoriphagus faecimaris TaxID=686796 RepID=A0A1G6V7C6_9BACT|nr:hypothetical protein SAMN04488104_10337 [Algoriphagus faecimaris]